MNKKSEFVRNQLQYLLLQLEVNQLNSLLEFSSEILLLFAKYSFLFENSSDSINSCTADTSQFLMPQAFRERPVMYTDPNGLWESKNQWNSGYEEQYSNYVSIKINEYERNNQKFTCEDLALSLLIDFASENSLPLKIRNGTGFYNSNDKKFTDPEVYKEKVLSTTAARSLLKYTVQVDKNKIKPGDLILMDDGWGTGLLEGENNRLDNKPSHTQVIENNVEGILKIKQGNFDEGSYIYGSKDYGGEKIAERTLDLNTDTFYKNGNDGKNNAEKRYGIWYRRWNFESFNDLNVQPIDEKSMSPRMKHEMSK